MRRQGFIARLKLAVKKINILIKKGIIENFAFFVDENQIGLDFTSLKVVFIMACIFNC